MPESDAGSVLLHGDTSRRVTVPLPRSLPELQYAANRNFARNTGAARMFHHGTSHLHHPHHIGKIKDGDVVIVEAGLMPKPEAPNFTTHQADYVKHPIEVRAPLLPQQQPAEGGKFEGATSYKTDYVKHPLGCRKPMKPPKSGIDNGRANGNTGQSMYTTQYPWHSPAPRQAVQPPPGVPISSSPFEAVTSYMNDYVKHNARPRSAAPAAKPRSGGENLPFEASTTYNNDFQNFPSARTEPARPMKATLRPDGAPFEGSSEYKREYIELKHEQRPMVHLEPEIRREPRVPRAASAAASSRK